MPRRRVDNTSMVRKLFADNLSDVINESGKSIREISEGTGISTGMLSKYQNDVAEAGIDKLAKLADYFNVSTDWLLGRTRARSPSAAKQAVCNYLTLSEGAVDALRLKDDGGELDGARHFFFDLLLNDPRFSEFVDKAYQLGKNNYSLIGKDPDSEITLYRYAEAKDSGFSLPVTVGNLSDAFKLSLLEEFIPIITKAYENWYKGTSAYFSGEGANNG